MEQRLKLEGELQSERSNLHLLLSDVARLKNAVNERELQRLANNNTSTTSTLSGPRNKMVR